MVEVPHKNAVKSLLVTKDFPTGFEFRSISTKDDSKIICFCYNSVNES